MSPKPAKPLSQPFRTGTALPTSDPLPTLFTPLQIRGLALQNRIVVSPMGMYSSPDAGHLTDFHRVHLGQFALRGAGLTFTGVLAVSPAGRTSPLDGGLWQDSQTGPAKKVIEFVHGLGQKIGVQIGHSGWKGGMKPIVRGAKMTIVEDEEGGWAKDVMHASPVAFAEGYIVPREMTKEDIDGVVRDFAAAAKRAVEAGFDVIEVHAGHGYLLSSFLSPLSNHRTDSYGGSFSNRIRFLVEVSSAIRAVLPYSVPLFVRFSATDWMEWSEEESWDINDSIKLSLVLADLGVDLIDVSSGSNTLAQKIPADAYYQINLAEQIRAALKKEGKSTLVGAVGRIETAEIAKDVVEENEGGVAKADLAFVGKQFLRDPNFVLTVARELNVPVQWPIAYWRAQS